MKRFVTISILVMSLAAFAQDPPITVQQQVENLADITGSEMQEDDYQLQHLDYLKNHPLDLNTASVEDLRQIRLLNAFQIDHFFRYRELLGPLVDQYELQAVPSWDIETIRRILPFVTVGQKSSFRETFLSRLKGEHTLMFRVSRILEISRGYQDTANGGYLGDRNHILLRYRYQYKNLLYFGLTGEKDAGEEFFRGSQSRGFDFYSFHFFARNLRKLRTVVMGDYSVNMGQGLIQWHSMGFGKGPEVMFLKRQAPVLLPYRSAGEFFFYRGLAFTLQIKRIQATGFFSSRKLSGNIDRDSNEKITSLGSSGLHRSLNELSDRNSFRLGSAGGNIVYERSGLKMGLNMVVHRFNLPTEKKAEPYNLFAFKGKNYLNASLDYSYTHKNLHVFGELAVDRNKSLAGVIGALLSVDPRVDLSFLYRRISPQYQSLFANGLTENSTPVNERGAFLGMAIKLSETWRVSAYADLYYFPWLRYRVSAPTRGQDYLVQWTYHPSRHVECYLRFRTETKSINQGYLYILDYPEPVSKKNLRLHLSAQVSQIFSVRSRVEMTWIKAGLGPGEEGFLGYVEAACKPGGLWAVNARLQYFETGSYDSRLYAYESDVLFSSTTPAFFDTGVRWYLNVRFRPVKKMTFWMRWAQSLLKSPGIGSGSDLVPGNTRTELKAQFLYSF